MDDEDSEDGEYRGRNLLARDMRAQIQLLGMFVYITTLYHCKKAILVLR
mgnify:CR=1 FL=1